MEPLNRTAVELVDEAIDFAAELRIDVHELDNGATVVDCGVAAPGGYEAGVMVAEIQTAGLATIDLELGRIGETPIPTVEFSTDHPGLALLCAQKAGWELGVDGFEGLGSGPARALVAEEVDFERMNYRESHDFAVLAIESERLPTAAVAEHVAERCDVDPQHVFLVVTPTASVTGSVSVAARAAELAVFAAAERGYDPTAIRSAMGTAPVAPVAGSEAAAIGRVNDSLAYGSSAYLVVESTIPDFEAIPSSAGTMHGRPFAEIFAEYGWDFYEIPETVFAPAEVTMDVIGGPTETAGTHRPDILIESFELE